MSRGTMCAIAGDGMRLRHCPELDGIRGAAIGLVLMVHLALSIAVPEDCRGALPAPVSSILGMGWVGVDLFFVLSGFLITGVLVDARERGASLWKYTYDFFVRRALRVLPLFVLLLVGAWMVFPEYGAYWRLSAVFLSNYSWSFGVAPPDFAGVLWSLCVEEHFYLLFPWVVWFMSRRGLAIILLVVIFATPCIRAIAWDLGLSVPNIIYPQTQFRIDGLAWGGIVALFIRRPNWSQRDLAFSTALVIIPVVIAALGSPIGLMRSTTASAAACAIRYTQISMTFAGIVLFAYSFSGRRITSLLRFPPLMRLGRLSYCVYLIHEAIFIWGASLFDGIEPLIRLKIGSIGFVVLRNIVLVAVTLLLAEISWRWLERPAMRFRDVLGAGDRPNAR
jgi:peptidoglycan/LPS O-acetylase OafA/YrhL